MLKDLAKARMPEPEDLDALRESEQAKLAASQTKLKEAGLPVLVMLEGWGAAGKGETLRRVIRNLDPRFYIVKTMRPPAKEEKRYPFLRRYLLDIPEAGRFTFYDTFWMDEIVNGRMSGKPSDEAYEQRVRSVNTMERQLTDNGYLVMKFFFYIGQVEQLKRFLMLLIIYDTKWCVSL